MTKAARAGGFGIGGVGNLHHDAGGHVGPIDGGIEAADEVGMSEEFFGDEFEDGFVIEGGLLGFAEPGGWRGVAAGRGRPG